MSAPELLTDRAAADQVRVALGRQIDGVGAVLPAAEDPELRAALVVTSLLGVTIGHQLLGLASLRNASVDRIATLLRPAIKALAEPTGERGAVDARCVEHGFRDSGE